MRLAWVGLLGCAGSVPGREIPVYREYTRPVQFYDDAGAILEGHARGPDQQALKTLREDKAQESYLGKEPILNLGFESGESVFRSKGSGSARPAPMSSGGEENRRRPKQASSQNWLAQSISLPHLGQTPGNAAASAISAGASESSWGWLAGEIAEQNSGSALLPEDMLSEEDYNPLAAQQAEMTGSRLTDPYSSQPSTDAPEEDSHAFASVGGFPEREAAGQKPSDQARERAKANTHDWGGGDREASATMKDYAVPSGIAKMSRTSEMIAGWTTGARPDFSDVATVGSRGLSDFGSHKAQRGLSTDFSPRAAETSSRMGWGSSSSFGGSSPGASAWSGGSSWKGGWNAQRTPVRAPSAYRAVLDPVVPIAAPSAPINRSKPGISSGGTKPAWY